MIAITPDQATIFAAAATVLAPLLSIIVSVWTTRYTLKHGPNYEKQISDLNKSLGTISETHAKLLSQQAASEKAAEERRLAQEKRDEAARWKPEAKLQSKYEGTELKNELILKSSDEFRVLEISLLSATGAKLAEIPQDQGMSSRGFLVHIKHPDILKLVGGSLEFGQTGRCSGTLLYRVERDNASYQGTIPLIAQQEIYSNTAWIRLVG
jgi:hypothetical protein